MFFKNLWMDCSFGMAARHDGLLMKRKEDSVKTLWNVVLGTNERCKLKGNIRSNEWAHTYWRWRIKSTYNVNRKETWMRYDWSYVLRHDEPRYNKDEDHREGRETRKYVIYEKRCRHMSRYTHRLRIKSVCRKSWTTENCKR